MASIGKRDSYVQLQTRVNATNDYNETIPGASWTNDASIWVSINPISGREYSESDKSKGLLTHKITVQDQVSITAPDQTKRFVDEDGLIYNIKSFARKRQRRYMTIDCLCIQDGTIE